MSTTGSDNVFVGAWIDHSLGPVRRWYLTVDKLSGQVLTAALPIFVTLVAARSWKLVAYALHQFGDHSHPRSGFLRSQEVILRNSSSDIGALLQPLHLSWAWSRVQEASLCIFRGGPVIFIAIIQSAAAVMLALLVSQVAVGNIARAKSKSATCGSWAVVTPNSGCHGNISECMPWQRSGGMRTAALNLQAQQYVESCYNKPNSSKGPECDKFVTRKIRFEREHNATCPFDSSMCIEGPTGAFKMDTGLFSSSRLGYNSKEGLDIRRVTACSPVAQQGRGKMFDAEVWDVVKGKRNITGEAYFFTNGTTIKDDPIKNSTAYIAAVVGDQAPAYLLSKSLLQLSLRCM